MDKLDTFGFEFEPALIEEIKKFGELKHFKEGDIIMDYGKYIRMMPLVIKGTLKVLKKEDSGKEILLYYLSNNETCSMAYSCCLEEKKSDIRAIAEGEVDIIAIPHNKLDEWLHKYPSWKNYIMRSFSERFSELLKSIESIAFHKLDDRLIAYLKEKQRLSGSSVIKASHYQIADELATSRVVVSRLLKILENNGKILLYRNEIKLLKDFEC
ncbi:Crp/Fnr family transcriptional regulator [Mucilaginibacter flavidus]|uniref:Crp/Fnr family transcriptional regulator n=1 Tax=Mucilaginibacter flavidus TaxID=2949309 RepID=UPI002093CCE5|nr:Crp/Fnr family transcriptional regulator [Mucilaginibacter flavidus]MCO5946774.1 Crp/Fnr family transcriptional regulator [Mucilaginibacter flavidus]